ncbi:MAG: DUF4007 family protein [Candidatus Thiodiazotropha sp. (ex Ctena orbiculata)]|nr:DUF4007 family protein [Candidatus Thiodiazotropha taylori]
MRFNPNKVGFGRHETFALRYSWLTKGFQALGTDPEVFTSDEATVTLGVGKNMVNAIRYWLLASRLIEPAEDKGFQPTPIGRVIFDKEGYDPYLEDEATIWLIHWLITTNPEQATAWYWFFNQFHKPEFVSQEVATALYDFVSQRKLKSAATTVKNDATIVLRMYARSKGNGRTPLEEALDSPLSQLNLISQSPGGRSYTSHLGDREGLPNGILGYAIAELFEYMGVKELPIEDLMYSKDGYPSPGATFRLTENALITKLERMMHEAPGVFEIRETAGIHQIYLLEKVDPKFFLKRHYKSRARRVAA